MNVLAVGCHPDDLEIGCGGTLARYAAMGDVVIMCNVANGDKGHVELLPDVLGKIRAEEARGAAEIVGAKEILNLNVPDLEVDSYNENTVKKVIDAIRYAKPDMIITHSPDDYMRDHLEVSRLVFDASFSSSVPHMFTDNPYWAKISPIYYMDTLAGVNFIPTEYVDISETLELKLSAINCHESQIKWLKDHDGIDFLDFTRTVSKFRGLQCGVPYAEGFRQCNVWPRNTTRRLLP